MSGLAASGCAWYQAGARHMLRRRAQVSFEADVVLSPANEYEVLQLLLGECRERLAAYAGAPCAALAPRPCWRPAAASEHVLHAGRHGNDMYVTSC